MFLAAHSALGTTYSLRATVAPLTRMLTRATGAMMRNRETPQALRAVISLSPERRPKASKLASSMAMGKV
ncbi:hypothetical protein D3C87_1692890 [compost metagenome]